jgi:hypothetical protein
MAVLLNGTNGLIQAYDYQVPTTGFSYTFAAGTQTLVMNPAGTLATGTITMPASPSDGMTITFSTTQQITALTLSGNTGQTIIGGVNSLGAEQSLSYIYRAASTTWLPMTTQVAQPTGPAFSAVRGTSSQSVSGLTYTKIQFNAEEFDTNNNYDSTTNYRFTPTVAGYYQVNLTIYSITSVAANAYSYIYKNGSIFKYGSAYPTGGGGTAFSSVASALIYMNGSTDYLEGYYYVSQTATVFADPAYAFFQASLVRAA